MVTVDQRHQPIGNRRHDLLVLDGVLMLVINIGNAAIAMVLNPVHRITAKP